MRSCTSTNIHEALLDNPNFFSLEESLRVCREAGFEAMDLNLHTAAQHGNPLSKETGWEGWVEKIGLLGESLELDFPYAHTYFYVWPPASEEELAQNEALLCRTIRAAGMLGVRWIVVHPYSVCDDAWYSHKDSLAYNLPFMRKYADIARQYPGLGLAVENMVEDRRKRRFGSSAEDLLTLLDALDDPLFGLCWDFGHAERSNIDQCAALRQMGERLKVVHVHDTNADADHTLPLLGGTNWRKIMPVMKEIGYAGDWNYECHNFTHFLPPDCRKAALRLAYEVNQAMIAMAEG